MGSNSSRKFTHHNPVHVERIDQNNSLKFEGGLVYNAYKNLKGDIRYQLDLGANKIYPGDRCLLLKT